MLITQCLTPMVRQEKAKLLNHFYTMLTATFSHELLTPLNAQLNLLKNMQPYVSDERGLKLLDVISNSSQMLLFFIHDILDIFKIKQGHFDKQEESFDVRKAILFESIQ
jgi:signal transduction histidine kinase